MKVGGEGVREDEMIGWRHPLSEYEFDQALGDGEGQGNLVCRSPWGCKELHRIGLLNNYNLLMT